MCSYNAAQPIFCNYSTLTLQEDMVIFTLMGQFSGHEKMNSDTSSFGVLALGSLTAMKLPVNTEFCNDMYKSLN